MFQLTLRALTVATPTGTVLRVSDLTDWTQAAPTTRTSWAVFLSATKVGSVAAQDADLDPLSYEPQAFQSGANAAGTVDVPVSTDGVYCLRAVAVPVLVDAAALSAAASARLFYRLDTHQFFFKYGGTAGKPVTTWADVLDAARSDHGGGAGGDGLNLLDRAGEAYAFVDFALQLGLTHLNLAYLQAGNYTRAALLTEYATADLLARGAGRQFAGSFYADAATSLTAAERQLGACLPGFGQSLPALPVGCGTY